METFLVEVKLLVSIEAPDFDDAKDMLEEVFGAGELEGLGINCHGVALEQYTEG